MSDPKNGLGMLAVYGDASPNSSAASPEPHSAPLAESSNNNSPPHHQGQGDQQQQTGGLRIKGSAAAPPLNASANANGTGSWQSNLIQQTRQTQASQNTPSKRPDLPARPEPSSSSSVAAQPKPRSSHPPPQTNTNSNIVELLPTAGSQVGASGSRPNGTCGLEMDKVHSRPGYPEQEEYFEEEEDASRDRSSRRRARSPVQAAAQDQPNKRPRQNNGSSSRSYRRDDDYDDYDHDDHYRQSSSGSSKRQRTYSSRSPSPRSHHHSSSSHHSRSHSSRQSRDDWVDYEDRHRSDRRRHSRWDTRPAHDDGEPSEGEPEHSPVQAAHEQVLQQATSAPVAPTPAPPAASSSQADPTQSRMPSGIKIAFPSKPKLHQQNQPKHLPHHPHEEFSAAPETAGPLQPPHASYVPPVPTTLERKKREIHKELDAPKKPISEVQTVPWKEPLLPTAINANINTSDYADAFLSLIPSEPRSHSQRRQLIGTSDMNSTYKKQDQLGEGTFGVVWRGQVIRDFEPASRSDAWHKAAGLGALVLTSQGQVKRRRVERGTVVALKQILHHQEFEGVRVRIFDVVMNIWLMKRADRCRSRR